MSKLYVFFTQANPQCTCVNINTIHSTQVWLKGLQITEGKKALSVLE